MNCEDVSLRVYLEKRPYFPSEDSSPYPQYSSGLSVEQLAPAKSIEITNQVQTSRIFIMIFPSS